MGLKKRLNEKEFYRDERTTKCRVITIRKCGEKENEEILRLMMR